MPEVIPTGCRQGGLQLLCPFLVGLGEPPHLIGSQAKVTKHVPERLAVVDRVEELLPHLYGEPRLRIASEACPRGVVLRFTASVAVAAFQPAGQGAVCRLWATSAALRIKSYRGLHATAAVSRAARISAQGRASAGRQGRHIAHGSRLANRRDLLLSIHHTNASHLRLVQRSPLRDLSYPARSQPTSTAPTRYSPAACRRGRQP
jgi:hypothetical protein